MDNGFQQSYVQPTPADFMVGEARVETQDGQDALVVISINGILGVQTYFIQKQMAAQLAKQLMEISTGIVIPDSSATKLDFSKVPPRH